jgi:hypothetical protein
VKPRVTRITSATTAPPAEKRTRITSAIKQENVEEVANVNFNLSIGTAVAGVRYYPMPARIVEIYPEWRGYDFILVHGKYIVLRPRTLRQNYPENCDIIILRIFRASARVASGAPPRQAASPDPAGERRSDQPLGAETRPAQHDP